MGAAGAGGREGTLASGAVLLHVSASDGTTPVEDDERYACIGSGRSKDETGGADMDGDGGLDGEPVRVTASEDGLSVTVPVVAVALIGLPASPPSTTFWEVVGKVGSSRAAVELTNAGEGAVALAAVVATATAAAGAAFPSS